MGYNHFALNYSHSNKNQLLINHMPDLSAGCFSGIDISAEMSFGAKVASNARVVQGGVLERCISTF
jgi:hypothetical protein